MQCGGSCFQSQVISHLTAPLPGLYPLCRIEEIIAIAVADRIPDMNLVFNKQEFPSTLLPSPLARLGDAVLGGRDTDRQAGLGKPMSGF